MSESWSLDGRLRDLARTMPDRVGVASADGTLTWAQLDRLADAVAARTRALEAGPGSVVAVDTADAPWTIGAIAGVLRTGAIAAPVPSRLATAERARALEVLGPAATIEAVAADVATAPPRDAAMDPPTRDPDPEAPAVVVLSSGTTGLPNGVVLSHRAMAASAAAWLAVLPPATGWLLAVGLGHVAGLGIVWRALHDGVPIRVAAPDDTAAIRGALAGDPAMTHLSLVPAQLERLLSQPDAPPSTGLRATLLGGGPVPAALVSRAIEAGWPIVATYGLTEAGSGVTALATTEARVAAGSAGGPLPGVTVTIADPDPAGVGEIVVTTHARCSGYLGEPPVGPETPLRTGDLGRLDEAGRLVIVDRRVDRIVRGGENIDPSEVEAVLVAHPALAEAAVVGLPHPRWGHVPVAAVVPRPGARVPPLGAIAAHVRASLAGYKVPLFVVPLDALPRSATGKVRREAVRALLGGAPFGELARPDEASITWRITASAPGANGPATAEAADADPRVRTVVLLPGTLSSAAQLDRLATSLAADGRLIVHALDRRGTGDARFARGERGMPVDVAVHVADLLAYLDARSFDRILLAGVSYGGVVALEFAARHPERVEALVAWEPPYVPFADAASRERLERSAVAVARAHAAGGPAAAAEAFLRAVAGDSAWERLGPRAREALARGGAGAVSDAALLGLRPTSLGRISAPTALLGGERSEPFYASIAEALAGLIRGVTRRTLAGLAHPAPITDPLAVATAIRDALRALAVGDAVAAGPIAEARVR